MSAAVEKVLPGVRREFLAPIAATLKALEHPLLRARWAHGWKIPPQAYEPFSLAYVMGFFERHCEEIGLLNSTGLDDARVQLVSTLLGPEALSRLDVALTLAAQHEINMIQAWQHGRKEADAQIGPDRAIACSWREYMYLEVEAYSFSYPRD
jgi:hypothetical protein